MAQLMITASELLELSGAHDGICLERRAQKGIFARKKLHQNGCGDSERLDAGAAAGGPSAHPRRGYELEETATDPFLGVVPATDAGGG